MAWTALLNAAPAIIGAGGAIGGLFHRRGEVMDPKAIRRFFDSANWSGQLRPEDYAAAQLAQSRLAGAAATTAQGARMNIARRYDARGLGGSPAEETSFARAAEDEAVGRERAATAANQQLYDVGLGREREQFSKNLAELGAMVGASNQQQYRNDLTQSTYYNSLLQFGPSILNGLGQLSGGGDTPADFGKPGGFPETGYANWPQAKEPVAYPAPSGGGPAHE